MNNNETDNITAHIDRLIPIIGKQRAASLQTAYLLGDEDYRKRILEIIDGLKATILSDSDLKNSALLEPPPEPIATQGEFQFGSVLYGKKKLYSLMLSRKDLMTHMGIFGSSGCGKTNIIYNLVRELNSLEVPVLIFDFSKRNYRDMLTLPELKDKLKIYTIGRDTVPFRFNPLKPPENVQLSQWAKEFAEVFDHAYWLMGGGRYVVLKALDDLYKNYAPGFPKIGDLKTWLERYVNIVSSQRERNWVATASRPLESLSFRETGEIFDTENGISPINLFEKGKITVLELDALSNDDKTFFIEILLQWIRDWLLANNIREQLVGVIILEEAHHVLNRDKTKKFGMETVTDLIFREIRELGIGMIYVDQHPSLVSYPALGNTSLHVYMNLGLDTKHSSDIVDASNMLGLKDEDTDYLRRLPVGHGFVLIRKSVFPNPFLISFPLEKVKRGTITDEKLAEQMKGEMIKEIELRKTNSVFKAVEKKDIENKMRRMNGRDWQIVELLASSKAAATSDIYKSLKISCSVFKKHAKYLLELGIIGFKKARVYRQNSVFYFLTHEGELAYTLKEGKLPEDSSGSFSENEMKFLKEYFTLKGWYVDVGEENIVIQKENKKRKVNFIVGKNPHKIYTDVERYAMDGETFFICDSEQSKVATTQQAAKFTWLHRGINLVMHIGTIGELKNGKDFKKIEFGDQHVY